MDYSQERQHTPNKETPTEDIRSLKSVRMSERGSPEITKEPIGEKELERYAINISKNNTWNSQPTNINRNEESSNSNRDALNSNFEDRLKRMELIYEQEFSKKVSENIEDKMKEVFHDTLQNMEENFNGLNKRINEIECKVTNDIKKYSNYDFLVKICEEKLWNLESQLNGIKEQGRMEIETSKKLEDITIENLEKKLESLSLITQANNELLTIQIKSNW